MDTLAERTRYVIERRAKRSLYPSTVVTVHGQTFYCWSPDPLLFGREALRVDRYHQTSDGRVMRRQIWRRRRPSRYYRPRHAARPSTSVSRSDD